MRVAVAGNHGLAQNAHFGRADFFDVFEFVATSTDSRRVRFVERRFTAPACGARDGGRSLAQSVELIADCVVVLASLIGPCARELLDERGIVAAEHAGPRLGGAEAILRGVSERSADSGGQSSNL